MDQPLPGTAAPIPEADRFEVPIHLIDIGPQMIRHDPNDEEIAELALSIQTHGLLQPIGVTAAGDRWQLRFGSRRLAAHVRLGRTTVAAVRVHSDQGSVKTVAIVENLQRRQLTLAEECDAVASLHHDEGLSPDQIATRLSRGRAWVLRRLAIPNLPEDLRAPCLSGAVSAGAAEALALIEDEPLRRLATHQAAANQLSVPDVRALVATLRENSEAIEAGADQLRQPGLAAPVRVIVGCVACGQNVPMETTALVRVCADGCAATTAARDADHQKEH